MEQRAVTSEIVLDRDVLEREVERIVAAADERGLTIRALGSLGVSIHCSKSASLLPSFSRTYADIDFSAYRHDARGLGLMIGQLGYVERRQVFIDSEGRRAIFDRPTDGIHLDLFYDRLDFCHPIPLLDRLTADHPTIPLAELLMSKLQIVRINAKDVVDAILLLLDHPLGATDDEVIDASRIARLCAEDWGLWRTLTLNLDKVRSLAASYPQLHDGQRERVIASADTLKRGIDAHPKSLSWRVRDRIGDRRKWWTEVEEV